MIGKKNIPYSENDNKEKLFQSTVKEFIKDLKNGNK